MTAGTFSYIFEKYQLLIVIGKKLISSNCLFNEWLNQSKQPISGNTSMTILKWFLCRIALSLEVSNKSVYSILTNKTDVYSKQKKILSVFY